MALAMSKIFFRPRGSLRQKTDVMRTSQVIVHDRGAAQGAGRSQTQSFPTTMGGNTDLLGL
jgi:hypothetical protein